MTAPTAEPKPRSKARPVASASARDRQPAAPNPWSGIDFRAHPEQYRVGRGEQGVLTAEPYKSELLPLWRFRTPDEARASAEAIFAAFVGYRRRRDYVGMDLARKFIQMGFTRARRYARHRGGRKYDADGRERPESFDPTKQASAEIFQSMLAKLVADRTYQAWRKRMRDRETPRARPPGNGSARPIRGPHHAADALAGRR